MKTLTVRLPEPLFEEISNEAEARNVSKSEIVRERLEQTDAPKPLSVEEFDDLEAFALLSQLLGFGQPEKEKKRRESRAVRAQH